jgi:apyrase
VLVIDAGSSGTRMYAYEWHAPAAGSPLPRLAAIPPGAAPHKVPRRALENRRAYKRVETEPGLDKFLDDPAALAAAALAPLLEWARAVVPRGRWARTPLLLFGTAGLRRLREGEQGRLLGAVRAALATSGFRFEPPWARVLTGADEAVFGWVGLNAAGGTLGTGRTVGALDLGGSSLEVAFAAEGAALGASSPGVNVSVLGARHTLFTHSHRHFGLDDAFERSVGLLLLLERRGRGEQPPAADAAGQAAAAAAKAAAAANFSAAGAARRLLEQLQGGGGALALEHPCLHQGYSQLYKRIPLDGRPPSPPEVRLSGGGDADACAALAAAVVAAPAACAAPPCALGAPQPRTAGAFVALSGFYVVRHFFGLPAGAGLAAVLDAGRAFCGQPWAAAAAAHPGELAVESYCFRAPYVGALVTQGLGLSQERVEIGARGTRVWMRAPGRGGLHCRRGWKPCGACLW